MPVLSSGCLAGALPPATIHGVCIVSNVASFTNWLKTSVSNAKETLTNEVIKFKSKDLLEAIVAGCAMVAYADGSVTSEEKRKMIGFLQGSDQLKVFDTGEVIKRFQSYVEKFDFDAHIGAGEAMSAIVKFKDKPQAMLVVSVCCAVGAADGDFDPKEKDAVRRMIAALGLDTASFGL